MLASAQARAGAPTLRIARAEAALYLAAPQMQTAPRGPQRRLARQLREAALRATPQELTDLERLERLVRCEAIGVFEAQHLLTDLIRGQLARDGAA